MSYLRQKCTKFNFGWGSAQTPLGELTALPDPYIAGFHGFPSKRREGKGREGRERRNKSPEWLSQKLGSTANAAVNS